MSVVEMRDVKKHYMLGDTRVEALRGVSLASRRASSWPSPGRRARARARS